MKIGIDAKWYFEGPPSGQRVVRSLVDHILSWDEKNQYVIFLDKRHKHEAFPAKTKSNVEVCYVWADNNLLSNVFILPIYSRKFGLDALLYQNFISPFDRSMKIAYIHDALFLSNPEYYTFLEKVYFAPLKLLTTFSDLIVTVSEEEKKRLLKFKFSTDPEKLVVVYHGVDSSFTILENHPEALVREIKSKYKLPQYFILYVGRLNLRKNVDHLIRSVPLLKNRNIKLVIVGADDWKKSNHRKIINQLGIEDRIHFTGAIYQELNIVYSLATVFCFPSYAESFGLPPLEAMASGVPVVVSKTTSLPEVCGPAAEYVDPYKPDEIAAAIDLLLVSPQHYAEKKRQGLERRKTFTWQRAAHTLIRSIEQNFERSRS